MKNKVYLLFFTTGSCAEYHFKPLRQLLSKYIYETSGKEIDLSNHSDLFDALQRNTHIVAQYFNLRTQSYLKNVMSPTFGVSAYWYKQEFAKSRGMVHWYGLCWRSDREPHNLLHNAIQRERMKPGNLEKIFGHHYRTLQPYLQRNKIPS